MNFFTTVFVLGTASLGVCAVSDPIDHDFTKTNNPVGDDFLNLVKDVPLNEYPMVMAHDAATVYEQFKYFGIDKMGGTFNHINTMIHTQKSAGKKLSDLLNCGATALDLRVRKRNGKYLYEHGSVEIPLDFEEGIKDIIDWANKNPKELVYLKIKANNLDNGGNAQLKTELRDKLVALGVEHYVWNTASCGIMHNTYEWFLDNSKITTANALGAIFVDFNGYF
eukprot:Pgem_evm2s12925